MPSKTRTRRRNGNSRTTRARPSHTAQVQKAARRRKQTKSRVPSAVDSDTSTNTDGDLHASEVEDNPVEPAQAKSPKSPRRPRPAPIDTSLPVQDTKETAILSAFRLIQTHAPLLKETYESIRELGILRESEDEMEWQMEQTQPVHIVRTPEEMSCYDYGVIHRSF